jgi:hypothetical protein
MSCTTPILKAASELIEYIQELSDDKAVDDRAATRAINSALGTWGSRVKACFCYEYPCPVVCGVCEYPLPCCGIRDVVVWIRPRVCGCRKSGHNECCNEGCWYRLDSYELYCDTIITNGKVEGDMRLQIYTQNPQLSLDCWTLAKDYVPGDSEIWIKGRVQLPPLGWLRMGDCDQDYVSFRCWKQTQYDYPPQFDIKSIEAWVDGDINPDDGTDLPGISATEGIDVADVACGVNTVAYTIGDYCFSNINRVYAKGEAIELGIASPTAQAFSALENQALVHVHKTLLTRCASPSDRQFYADRMQLYSELSERDMIGFKADRQPVQRTTLASSFWFGSRNKCHAPRSRSLIAKKSYILG